MVQRLLNFPRCLMLMILLVALVCLSGCGSSSKNKEGEQTTNSKKTIIGRPGDVRVVADDTPIVTFRKDSKGVLTKVNDVAKKGEFILADTDPKAEVVPVPGAAEKK